MNQNPEQIARDKIDQMLTNAGWLVQSKDEVNLSAGKGVALRETNTESGSADYILFVNSKAIGVGVVGTTSGLISSALSKAREIENNLK